MTTPTTVAAHFTGKAPTVRAIYRRLIEVAGEMGQLQEDPKKTSIHLIRKTAFAGVETRSDYLLLNLKSDHPLRSPRVVVASEKLSARRYHTKVRLTSISEVDAELVAWIRHAYEISG